MRCSRPGPAADRALAYLAHGETAMHDQPACSAKCSARSTTSARSSFLVRRRERHGRAAEPGAAVSAALRHGPEWARAVRPLVLLFTVINLFVTWIFNADVEAQGGAYATGVLVLMSSACVATVIDRWRERQRLLARPRCPGLSC